MPAKVYKDKDADLGALQGKTLAVLGFGSQGHAHALNLKDSGLNVIIGLYPGSKSKEVAEQYGFKVYETGEAVAAADSFSSPCQIPSKLLSTNHPSNPT